MSTVANKGNGTIEISMEPQQKPMQYDTGQFMYITVHEHGTIKKEEHPFSVTSNPQGTTLSFAAKGLGDFTQSLTSLKKGDRVTVEGSYGKFLFDIPNQRQLWIAGGIGVTPFLSKVRSLSNNSPLDAILYYIVSTEDEAAYLKELQNIQNKVSTFKVIPYFSKSQGRISAEVVAQTVKDFAARDIFLCGPIPMMQSLHSQFKALGIKSSQIHSEEFQLI